MPRSANQKLKLLCLCRILWERTDEDHPLTVPELIQALEADRLRMAAIDVFSPEPLPPDSPFYRLPEHKVILTSHMAGFCQERAWHQYDKGMDNLMRFLRGEGLCCNCTPGVEESPDYPVRGGSLFGSLSC